MTSMDEILRKKQPNERSVDILLDSKLKGAVERLENEKQQAVRRGTQGLGDRTMAVIDRDIEKVYDEILENTQTFRFRALPRRDYDKLVGEHPPSAEEKKEWEEAGGEGVLAYSPETFVPALIAACSLEPKITLDQATEIVNTWGEGDIEALFFTALAACKERTSIPFTRNASGGTPGSGSKSNIATIEESHTLSS